MSEKAELKKKYSELVKNTGALAIASFSSKILVFLLIPLYTSILSTEEYGYYDLVVTTVQLIAPIFTCNVTDGVLRFTLDKDNDTGQIVKISIRYILASIIPGIILLVIIVLTGLSTETRQNWGYISLYYLGYIFNQCFPQIAKGVDRVKEMAISGVIGTIVTAVGCAVFLIGMHMTLGGFLLAYALGQIVPSIYLFFKLNIASYLRTTGKIDKRLEKRLLVYSVPLILTNIGWWLNNTSDRYIITIILGMSVNGLLSVAYKIPSILSVLYGLFTQAWQISAMKEYGKDGSKSFYNSVFIYLNIFVYFAAAALMILTKPIAHIAFAKDFYQAWVFVPFLLISGVFTASAGFIAPILTSTYHTKPVALSTIVGGVINIVLNIILALTIGAQGITIATAISSFVILFIRYKALDNVIESNIFLRMLIPWILLTIQAVFELNNIYIGEAVTIGVSTAIFAKDIRYLFVKVGSYIGERNKK